MNHLAKLRKENQDVSDEIEMCEIIDDFRGVFPKVLRTEDQGRFIIGYYHQRQKYYQNKKVNGEKVNGKDAAEDESF